MAIKPKPKKNINKDIESAPNKSLKPKKRGYPTFKSGIDCQWKKRLVELPEEFIKECATKKLNDEIDGLDHALFLALTEWLKK